MKISANVKSCLSRAVWIALGVTLGGMILPRILQPATHPPLTAGAVLFSFIVVYLVSVLAYLLIGWIRKKPWRASPCEQRGLKPDGRCCKPRRRPCGRRGSKSNDERAPASAVMRRFARTPQKNGPLSAPFSNPKPPGGSHRRAFPVVFFSWSAAVSSGDRRQSIPPPSSRPSPPPQR